MEAMVLFLDCLIILRNHALRSQMIGLPVTLSVLDVIIV